MPILDFAWEVILADNPHLKPRQRDAVARALDSMDRAGFVLLPTRLAAVTRDGAGYDDLPCPRLQLRWEDDWKICHYEMVMKLGEYDIRRERGVEEGDKKSRFMSVPLGCTKREGGREPLWPDGHIETPWRDGCHIRFDMKQLRLPGFVVWKEHTWELREFPDA